jgi:hypothetical protein
MAVAIHITGVTWWGSHDLHWASTRIITPEEVYQLAMVTPYIYPTTELAPGVVVTDLVYANRAWPQDAAKCPYGVA